MQQVDSTPQAVSRLQYRGFIRNRLRGANAAQSKLLRGGKGGRCSGAAVQRCSGAAVDRWIGGSVDRWIGDLVTQVTRGTTFVWCSEGVPESMQGAQLYVSCPGGA